MCGDLCEVLDVWFCICGSGWSERPIKAQEVNIMETVGVPVICVYPGTPFRHRTEAAYMTV